MKKSTWIVLIAAWGVAGCTSISTDTISQKTGEIRLKSSVYDVKLDSRAPYVEKPSAENPFTATVIATMASDRYTNLYTNGTITFRGSEATAFNPGAAGSITYPDATTTLYFRGLHPADRWVLENGKARRSLYGKEDIMLSDEVSSSRQASEISTPTLSFRHMLTKLEMCIKASSEKAIEVWKSVRKIELVHMGMDNPSQEMVIELQNGKISFETPTPSFNCYGMEGREDGKKSYSEDIYAGQAYKLTLQPVYQAYTLAPPVIASPLSGATEYTFRVTATDELSMEREIIVPIDLKTTDMKLFSGSTAGYAFVIVLNFISTHIEATAIVQEWEEGGNVEVPVG